MYFVYSVSSESYVTIYVNSFENIMVFCNLMLIWFSYSVTSHYVVAVGLQEASHKVGPDLFLKCIMVLYVQWRKLKNVGVQMSRTIMRTLQNGMAVRHPVFRPDLAAFLFWILKLALK